MNHSGKVLALVLGVVTASGLSWRLLSRDVFDRNAFDEKVWFAQITNETDSKCYRGGMANDIKNRLLRVGMSQEAVTQLLGKPDWSSDFEFQYVLGMCSGMGIDYDNLHIYFDSHRRLVSAQIIQH